MRPLLPVMLSLGCALWLGVFPGSPLSFNERVALYMFIPVVLLALFFKKTFKIVTLVPLHMGFWVIMSVVYFVMAPHRMSIPATPEPVAEATAASTPVAVEGTPVAKATPKPASRTPSITGPIRIPGDDAPSMRTSVHDTSLAAPFLNPGATPTAKATPTPSGFGSGL